MIRICENTCVGCGRCAAICPLDRIVMREGKAQVVSECMECGHCYSICPQQAIAMPDVQDDGCGSPVGEIPVSAASLLDLIRSRRSIRRFQNKPVSGELLAELLEAGRYTPTAGNAQDVRYVVIQQEAETVKRMAWDGIRRILEETRSPEHPLAAYRETLQRIWDQHEAPAGRDKLFFGAPVILLVLSASSMNGLLAASTIELMARAEGLGALYCGFAQLGIAHSAQACEFLQIHPEQIRCCLLLGHPDVRFLRVPARKKAIIQWR